MSNWLWFGGGLVLGVAVVARLKPANESNCCKRVENGIKAEIVDTVGPLGSAINGVFEGLGLSTHLPRLLDDFGVPLDA